MTATAGHLAARLIAALADLDGYIDQHAAELAAPLIAAAEAAFDEQLQEAEFQNTRLRDLTHELRRHLAARERLLGNAYDDIESDRRCFLCAVGRELSTGRLFPVGERPTTTTPLHGRIARQSP